MSSFNNAGKLSVNRANPNSIIVQGNFPKLRNEDIDPAMQQFTESVNAIVQELQLNSADKVVNMELLPILNKKRSIFGNGEQYVLSATAKIQIRSKTTEEKVKELKAQQEKEIKQLEINREQEIKRLEINRELQKTRLVGDIWVKIISIISFVIISIVVGLSVLKLIEGNQGALQNQDTMQNQQRF